MSFGLLIDWYMAQCDGLWEHQHHGFKVSTLDNPGVRLRIDLNETGMEKIDFARLEHRIDSETEWIACEKTSDNYFDGCCHPRMFDRLVMIFLEWETKNRSEPRMS